MRISAARGMAGAAPKGGIGAARVRDRLSVVLVGESQVARPRRARRRPLHRLFDRTVVAGCAIGRLGPERSAGIRRAGVAAECTSERARGAASDRTGPAARAARPSRAAGDRRARRGRGGPGPRSITGEPARGWVRSAGGSGATSALALEQQRHAGMKAGLVPVERCRVRTIAVLHVARDADREPQPVRRAPLGVEAQRVHRRLLEAELERAVEGRSVGGERERGNRKRR